MSDAVDKLQNALSFAYHRLEQQKYVAENKKEVSERFKRSREYWRNAAITKLGGACVRCGFLDRRALQFDHIKGGGAKDRKTNRHNGTASYTFYKLVATTDQSQKFQLLCANCNLIKAHETGEFKRGTVNRSTEASVQKQESELCG